MEHLQLIMDENKALFNIQHMHVTELKKGLSFALHRHDICQLYCVLDGKVAYFCDGKNFVLNSAEAIVIASGKSRSLEVLSDQGQALVVIFSSAVPVTKSMSVLALSDYQLETAKKLADAIRKKSEPQEILDMRFNYLATEIFDIDFSNVFIHCDQSQKVCFAAERLMSANLEKLLKLDDIARLVGISRAGLERAFRKYYNTSVMHQYRIIRITAAIKMLEKGISISEVAYRTGFSSPQHFATVFKAETKNTPSEI